MTAKIFFYLIHFGPFFIWLFCRGTSTSPLSQQLFVHFLFHQSSFRFSVQYISVYISFERKLEAIQDKLVDNDLTPSFLLSIRLPSTTRAFPSCALGIGCLYFCHFFVKPHLSFRTNLYSPRFSSNLLTNFCENLSNRCEQGRLFKILD